MKVDKTKILENICYSELVYKRINKKLSTDLTRKEIQKLIFSYREKAPVTSFQKKGKNYYIYANQNNLRITINSSTFRIITVDKLK